MLRRAVVLLALSTVRGFQCDGGSTIPDDQINDDYCDCHDGTDEPRTGACPKQPFECENQPHRSLTVFASRVNDGVCDCCDGTDEFRSGRCPNTCVAAAVADLETASRSSLVRAQREEEGKKAAEDRAAQLLVARQKLFDAQGSLATARDAVVAAETVESNRRQTSEQRRADGEVAASLKLAELGVERLGVLLVRLALAKQVEGVDALYDMLANVDSIPANEMANVDAADMIMVAMEAKEETDPPDCVTAAEACGHEPDLIKLLPLAHMPLAALIQLVEALAVKHQQVDLLHSTASVLLRALGLELDAAAVASALRLLEEDYTDPDADAARAALASLEAQEKAASAVVDEFEPAEKLRDDFGTAHEYFPLFKQCYPAHLSPFRYNLCPFQSFTQDGRSLGKYAGWQQRQPVMVGGEAPATEERWMRFESGEPCNGTPRRASVLFVCGDQDKLEYVREPETCVYEARFATPSACSTSDVRARHDALAAAAAAAGLPYQPSEVLSRVLRL